MIPIWIRNDRIARTPERVVRLLQTGMTRSGESRIDRVDVGTSRDRKPDDDAAAAAPGTLEAPGQPRTLEAVQQGEGRVALHWQKPIDGGAVSAYKIERRERPAGEYEEVKTAYESEAILINQERGKDWEYRVIAGNTAGDGPPSNTVAVVL